MSNKLRCYPRRRLPGLVEKTVRLAASPFEANHADPESRFVPSFLVVPGSFFLLASFARLFLVSWAAWPPLSFLCLLRIANRRTKAVKPSRPQLFEQPGKAGGVDSVRIDLLEGRQEEAQRLRLKVEGHQEPRAANH